MNVEEALIDLGDRPLQKSPYSKVLKAMLNALIPTEEKVTLDRTGQDILTDIYSLQDDELREKILQKSVGSVRDNDVYRSTLLVVSGLIGLGVIVTTFLEVSGYDIISLIR